MGAGEVTAADLVGQLTRQVADFPSPGIQFKDLTPVFADPSAFAAVTDEIAGVASGADLIAGIDARGFLLGGAVAARLGTGVLAIRKGGKLPPPVLSERYQLEYGSASLELPADGIDLGGRTVVVVDDVLATGGTLVAAHRLLEQAGAQVAIAAVVIELAGLGGRDRITPLQVHSVSVF